MENDMEYFGPLAIAVQKRAKHRKRTHYPLGERKAFGLDLLDTVTYFLRPHIVTPSAHFVGQARAKASWERTMALAKAELGVP